jgi:multidrug resistance efflux pump
LQRQALLSAAEAEAAFFNAQELYDEAAERWNPTDRDEASDFERRLDDYVETEGDYRAAQDELEELLDLDEDDRQRLDAQDEFDSETENLSEAYADLREAVAENNESLDQEQIDMLLLIANLEIAREQLDRLDGNIDPDLLEAAQARLEVATVQITAAEAVLANYELRAPFAGTVLSLDDLNVGQVVNPGIPVAFIANEARWQVETTDLAEIDIPEVALGASATIKLDAFPGEEFSAEVVEIDPVGREHLGDMTYKVTLDLDESDARFLWNMTATVIIHLD